MENKFKSLAVAVVLATSTLAGSMSTAQAGGNFSVYYGTGHTGSYVGNGGFNNYGYGGYYSSGSNHTAHRSQPRRKACNPRRAVRIAHNRFGLYEPHIKRINRKKIVVKGYSYGHPAKIVFKRTRHGCKVIKTRGI